MYNELTKLKFRGQTVYCPPQLFGQLSQAAEKNPSVIMAQTDTTFNAFASGSRIVELVIINDASIQKEVTNSDVQEISNPHVRRLYAKTFKEAKKYFKLGKCRFKVFSDIKNLKELIKDQTILSQISSIYVYGNDINSYSSMRNILPDKIKGHYHDFQSYLKDSQPCIDGPQHFLNNQGKIQSIKNNPTFRSLLPAYAIYGQDFTRITHYKFHSIGCIKASNKKNEQSQFLDQLLKFNKFPKDSQFKITQQPINMYKSIQMNQGFTIENIIKNICLYKSQTPYYKLFNNFLRIAKNTQDFKTISQPFSNIYHSIKQIYLSQLEKNDWKRQERTLWRMARLQDVQNLKKNLGKTCEFYGVISTSQKPQAAFKFNHDKGQNDTYLIKIRIPKYAYEGMNDPRLKNDHGILNMQEIVGKPKQEQNKLKLTPQQAEYRQKKKLIYKKNMKQLDPQCKDTKYDDDPEFEFIINAMSSFKFVREGEEQFKYKKKNQQIKQIRHYLEFVYQTEHQIQEEYNELKKQIQKNKSENQYRIEKDQFQYLERVLDNYKFFNAQLSQVDNEGDVYILLGDPDKALNFYREKAAREGLKDHDIIKLIKLCDECGLTDSAYQIITNLFEKNLFEIDFKNEEPVQKIKQTYQSNEDFFQLTKLQQKKLDWITEKKEFTPTQKAEIQYQIALYLIADLKFQEAHSQLKQAKDLLERLVKISNEQVNFELTSIISSGTVSCIGVFDFLALLFDNKQVIVTDEDILNYLSILIHVHYYYDLCRINIKTIVKNQNVQNKIRNPNYQPKQQKNTQSQPFIQLSQLIDLYERHKKNNQSMQYAKIQSIKFKIQPYLQRNQSQLTKDSKKLLLNASNNLQKQMTQLKKNAKIQHYNSFSFDSKQIAQIQSEIETLKNKQPFSPVLAQLYDNSIIIKRSQISRIQTSANSLCVTQKLEVEDIDIQVPNNIYESMDNKTFFDEKKYDYLIESVNKDYQQIIKNKTHNQGSDNLQVLETLKDYAGFLLDVNRENESMQQSVLIIESKYGDKHSIASEAMYLRSRVYHSRGLHKKSFEALGKSVEILKKATIKPTSNPQKKTECEKKFELSEVRIRIELMKVKIYTLQTNLLFRAAQTLYTLEAILLNNNSSINTTLLAEVSQQKGNYYGLQHDHINCEKQFKKAIARISSQKGEKSIEVGNFYMALAKYALSQSHRKDNPNEKLIQIQKADEHFKKGFEIISTFPVNHPLIWSVFLMKAQINNEKKKIEQVIQQQTGKNVLPTEDIFKTQLYALKMAEKRYKSPSSITVIKIKIQTFVNQKEPDNWEGQKSFKDILMGCKEEIQKSLEHRSRDVICPVKLDKLAEKEIRTITNQVQSVLFCLKQALGFNTQPQNNGLGESQNPKSITTSQSTLATQNSQIQSFKRTKVGKLKPMEKK